jgi:hypothetical protein
MANAGVARRQVTFFLRKKESNQRKFRPLPCPYGVPCAARQAGRRPKLAALRQRPPTTPVLAVLLVTSRSPRRGGHLTGMPLTGTRQQGNGVVNSPLPSFRRTPESRKLFRSRPFFEFLTRFAFSSMPHIQLVAVLPLRGKPQQPLRHQGSPQME